MLKQRRGGERQIALFLLGVILLIPPVLLVFNSPVRVMGIPSLYLYVFAVWAGLIALTVLIARRIRLDDFAGRDSGVDDAATSTPVSQDMPTDA